MTKEQRKKNSINFVYHEAEEMFYRSVFLYVQVEKEKEKKRRRNETLYEY